MKLFNLTYVVIVLILQLQSEFAFARQTEYYTMVNSSLVRRECNMEGNQIVNGKLIGSNCRPFTARYCPWAVGNRNNCLIPCVHGAGPSSASGTRRQIKPVVCPWGPLKGRTITSVIIGDVGGAIGKGDVDVFVGLCAKKKMVYNKRKKKWITTDVCESYAPGNVLARNGTKGNEFQIAAALVNQHFPGVGTQFAEANSPRPIQVAAAQPPVVQLPSAPTQVAQQPAVVAQAPIIPPAIVVSPSVASKPVPQPPVRFAGGLTSSLGFADEGGIR
jgi:hypothetical protein